MGVRLAGARGGEDAVTRDAQARAWANKVAKGFNTTDVPMNPGISRGNNLLRTSALKVPDDTP